MSFLIVPQPSPEGLILLVGRDSQQRDDCARLFEREGFETVEVDSALEAEAVSASHDPDLIILDTRFSEAVGHCRRAYNGKSPPLILLSQTQDVADEIVALEMGADDLVSKPVNERLLLARTRALLRRSRRGPQPAAGPGCWRIDLNRYEAITPRDKRVSLTHMLAQIFSIFLSNPGQVFTHEALVQRLGREDMDATGIRTPLSRLRRRLEKAGEGQPLKTIYGSGYSFGEPPASGE